MKFLLLLTFWLTPDLLLAIDNKTEIENYYYGRVLGVDLPFLEDTEPQKVLLGVGSGFRLAVLNNNFRISVKNNPNLCDLKDLELLSKYSEHCLAVELYSVNPHLMSSSEKSQLETYKDNFEFGHFSGLELKTVTLYQGGVLFEYKSSKGLLSYVLIKELGSSEVMEYSAFDVSTALFEQELKRSKSRDIKKLVSYIDSYLKNELSPEEFTELDVEVIISENL
ncbi:hypothetical protein [Kangiella taiwanensis]|uniref:Uncharacterized protein n=1 Tax=Kangiella taiwanensis TaxID=1079179 RepID=A0ABP8I8U5_9GAMM|nr:hypothetical protein [Kangiella taiwanensis]